MKVAARNIAAGLARNDPERASFYDSRLERFNAGIDARLFGPELVGILGGDTLCELAEAGKLIGFLEGRDYQGRPLLDRLGGWMKAMQPLRGMPVVTYHKNWVYFIDLFGLEEAGTVEPKPGIPPSPKHVLGLTAMMRERRVRIVLAANYFDEQKVRTVAARAGAEPVIVPLYVGGEEGISDYGALVDRWIDALLNAARKTGVIE
jgi:ABC-type Zn uptake system ZnuABC Zn-binding protein ZnuA